MLIRKSGFSLVEMLIAASAMALVILYTMGTFTVQNQTATVIDQVSEAQQNMRAVANLVERDLRNAGYLVPMHGSVCGVDDTVGPDLLYMSDTDAIMPVDDLPASLQGVELAAQTTDTPALGSTTLNVDSIIIDGTASYKKDGLSAGADSDFRVGGGVIVVDDADTSRGVACGRITAVTSSTITAFFDRILAVPTAPADLKVIPAHVYRVDTAATPVALERDGTVLARDVEDLQAAFFYDADEDGVVDANEYKGDSGANVLNNTTIDGDTLREVRFHVVVATRADDPRDRLNAGRGQARENRTTASVAGDDGRHRRVYTSTVRIRNITS